MLKTHIAKDLLRIGAVFFRPDEPFIWASGIQSPVYCDNRLTLTAPDVRTDVEEGLKTLIAEHYPEAEVLMGTSTAGIAHAAITAHLMGLPMGYVRSGVKDHGRQNRIEGKLEPGQKVVVVEDLISTGGSAIETVQALRDAGQRNSYLLNAKVPRFGSGEAKGMILESVRGDDIFILVDVCNYSLTDFDTVAQAASEEGYIRETDIRRLIAFRDHPEDESWREQ